MGGPGSGIIPKGVGAPPPPGMDNRRGKLMCIKVRMLDDSVGVFHLGHKALGQALFDEVCRHLNLLECDYFSLEFTDCYGNRCWLDKDKPILRQITTTHSDARFYFIVKFYTPNPADLVEEYTRYLFALQIKRDLAMGELLCNENTAALLASYIVQSDCGDFAPEDYPDDSYLSSARFIPNQSVDFQRKVMENHMKLIGMSPGESDLILLETARRCDYYGVKLHAAKDVEGTDVSLTIAHMGIRVFHQLQCVSTFSWAKIRKLSFKRRKLLIKLHPESYVCVLSFCDHGGEARDTVLRVYSRSIKALKICSSFMHEQEFTEKLFFLCRYQGRTQKQLIDYVREHRKRREPFTRPIKSGLSSSSNGRLSRPAFFDHPAYATVSERSVNLIGSRTLPSRTVPVHSMNGDRSLSRGSHVSSQSHGREASQQPVTAGTMNYFPGAVSLGGSHGATTSVRSHRHRSSQNYPNNSSAAAVNGERMCLSDMESNDVCSMAGGGTMNSRCREQLSDFRSLQSSTLKSVKAGAVAVAGNSGNVADASDNDTITSVSLPNVLGDDVQVVCREFELKCECPPKSASGDNFLELQQPPRDYDNISEGSYKLSDNELRSAHSDVQAIPMNPVYATTFTAKRVGNVIVKKVVSNTRSTPNTTDDEDPYGEKRFGSGRKVMARNIQQEAPGSSKGSLTETGSVGSHRRFYVEKRHPSSAPASYAEYPLHQKLVPIEIDGPNVNLDEHRRLSSKKEMSRTSKVPAAPCTAVHRPMKSNRWPTTSELQPVSSQPKEIQPKNSKIVYTSKGTILQRPKIIPDEDSPAHSENIYSNVSLSHAPDNSQSYMTIAQPQQTPKTYGAVGPLPGKVISKENLVITPEGYRERKPKPVVPPKPRNLAGSSEAGFTDSISISSTSESKPNHPVVNLQKETFLPSLTATTSVRELNRPALISVQSEDHPEIQKCHLFNSDIPYVLTMQALANTVESSNVHRSLSGSRSPDSLRRRKSLDLVPKKRLPSPSNFSSQDHSLSPSTPDSGDVLEYLLRRRNVEKSAIAKRGRRGDPRRQTQPVRFNIPPSTKTERQQISAVSQPNLNGGDEEALYVVDDGSERHQRTMEDVKENDGTFKSINFDFNTETEVGRCSGTGKEEEEHATRKETTIPQSDLTDPNNADDFPPPPPPPPPLTVSLKQPMDSVSSQPVTEACMKETVETLPYADESASSRTSCASKDEINDKTPPSSSSTLRTPTGVLWTDF
uniref:Moesin/ezrin/radixin homolog 1 n=1 Tax=Setaria digitata TaxID=48799 RepID=A0A915PDA1_9BILA